MTKLTVKKQSLIDWTVEDESGKPLAWIEKKRDTTGKTFWFYEVRYSKNLGIGAERLIHDFAIKFSEAKSHAFKTIEIWNNE